MTTLSTIIITKNEAANILDCLKSVDFSDEIIVVDASSQDNTVSLCQSFSPKVKILVTEDWPGFGKQKQRALDLATKDWVLSIDADERVTENLKNEIIKTISNTSLDGFEIKFRSEYCGKLIRFGDWINDHQMILFRRQKGSFVTDAVHERIQLQGRVGKMKGLIYHHAFPNLHRVLEKMNQYSTASAAQKLKEGKKGGIVKALARGFFTFIRGYILRLGFLDGKQGLMLAISNAEGTYYRYIKLMMIEKV